MYCNIQTLISVFLHIFLQLWNNSYSPDPNQAHIKAQFIVLRVPLDHLSPSHDHTKGHEVVLFNSYAQYIIAYLFRCGNGVSQSPPLKFRQVQSKSHHSPKSLSTILGGCVDIMSLLHTWKVPCSDTPYVTFLPKPKLSKPKLGFNPIY